MTHDFGWIRSQDPELMAAFQDPEVMAALQDGKLLRYNSNCFFEVTWRTCFTMTVVTYCLCSDEKPSEHKQTYSESSSSSDHRQNDE